MLYAKVLKERQPGIMLFHGHRNDFKPSDQLKHHQNSPIVLKILTKLMRDRFRYSMILINTRCTTLLLLFSCRWFQQQVVGGMNWFQTWSNTFLHYSVKPHTNDYLFLSASWSSSRLKMSPYEPSLQKTWLGRGLFHLSSQKSFAGGLNFLL